MYERFLLPPKHSFFLFGPRGTGKSTWLKKVFPKAFWIDLLEPELFRFYSAGPERLKEILKERSEKIIVIDEIQKVPGLLDVIHSLIEKKLGYQFIMTGSSARKLKKHGVNLLGGRALKKHMSPFYASEIGDSFDLKKNLKLGMLPVVVDSLIPKEILNAYVGIYLKEEVQAEGTVRNIGDFARFLEIMSFSHGSIINASTISRDCQIARKTVESYLLILEDLLLSFTLQVFRRKAKRTLATSSKFYYFDSGVFYSARPHNLYDVENDKEGPALEGLVAQHLKAWTDAQIEKHHLDFWRTSTKLEVDFIVSGKSCFLAIEVKNNKAVHPKDLRTLEIFTQDYPEATPILLYRGKHLYKQKNILCYPIDQYLSKIHPDQPLPGS